MLKTYENWEGSLTTYLELGDQVDEEMYLHFINAMPPATFTYNLVQLGEPYSISKENKPTYLTLERIGDKWIYKGTCHIGENIHKPSKY